MATSTIRIEGTRRVRSESEADARRHLDGLLVDVREGNETVFVETSQPGKNRGRVYQVEYRITVPLGTKVTVLAGAGPVDVRSVGGDVEVDVGSGTVTLDGTTGNVRATGAAGEIRASLSLSPGGTVELALGAGPITLDIPKSTSAKLRAATGAGLIRLLNLDLKDEDSRPLVFRGTMADGKGVVDLRSGAGVVTIRGTD
jgi:DUF4097 and DUF4098 domain-containing protein YvlB